MAPAIHDLLKGGAEDARAEVRVSRRVSRLERMILRGLTDLAARTSHRTLWLMYGQVPRTVVIPRISWNCKFEQEHGS